jgi:hypothetical protein
MKKSALSAREVEALTFIYTPGGRSAAAGQQGVAPASRARSVTIGVVVLAVLAALALKWLPG